MNELITLDKLGELFAAAGLERPRTATEVKNGVVNHTLDVDGRYIVRFNLRDPLIRKFKREEMAFGILVGTEVPVPKVHLLDESRSIFDADVLVTEKVSGQIISEHWKTGTLEQKHALARRAGEALARIHAVSFEAFGSLEDPKKQFARWERYLEFCMEDYWRDAVDVGVLELSLEAKLHQVFRKIEPILAQVVEPKLVHGDYHMGNVLGENGVDPTGLDAMLTGVVDFEWAFAGDPESDFRNPTNIQDSAAGSEEFLLEGYRAERALSNDHEIKTDFYRLLSKLELASVSAKHWLGKVPWGERNHHQILSTFHASLEKLLRH